MVILRYGTPKTSATVSYSALNLDSATSSPSTYEVPEELPSVTAPVPVAPTWVPSVLPLLRNFL